MFYTFKHIFTAFTAFAAVISEICQESVLTKLTKPTILEALSSAVAYVEFAPSFDGVFFGRYIRDLFNNDLCPWVVRV